MFAVIIIAVAGITALAHTAPFPFLLDFVRRDVSFWRMPQGPGQKRIYLTFDDGPNPAATGQILDLLRDKNVKATFFLIDAHAGESTAPLVRRMFEEGHAVGQHSDNRWLMLHSPSRLEAVLQADADRIEKLAGRRPCPVFRPHAGWRSVMMLAAVRRAHYRLVGWSWMTWDWVWFRKRTGERVAAQILAHATPGKIIVLHDGHHIDPAPDRQYALEAADRIVDGLRGAGFEFATFCEGGS